jgi:hypothetical protein
MNTSSTMTRSIVFSAVLLVTSVFVGSALKAQAATSSSRPAAAAAQSVDDSLEVGYWAAWAEAASH